MVSDVGGAFEAEVMMRRLFFSGLFFAALGVPYLVSEQGWLGSARRQLAALSSSDSTAANAALAPVTFTPADPNMPPPSLVGAQVDELAEIFRMDVSPTWVTSRWARVSTVLAELDLQGLRVPVVTGSRVDDLAGSLTYYFDKNHHVQRITFQGYTGDPNRLAELAATYYGLKPEPTLGAGMYIGRWNGRPMSALRISHAPVVRAEAPHSRMAVRLELNRPNEHYGLSEEFTRVLFQDRHMRQW